MARKLCDEKIWVLNLEIWVLSPGPKMTQQIVEQYFSQKCPGTSSLDSGHLDKPFGPLISNFFQYFWPIFLGRFFGLFFWFGDPLDPLTCISLWEGVIYKFGFGSQLVLRCCWDGANTVPRWYWDEPKPSQAKPNRAKTNSGKPGQAKPTKPSRGYQREYILQAKPRKNVQNKMRKTQYGANNKINKRKGMRIVS